MRIGRSDACSRPLEALEPPLPQHTAVAGEPTSLTDLAEARVVATDVDQDDRRPQMERLDRFDRLRELCEAIGAAVAAPVRPGAGWLAPVLRVRRELAGLRTGAGEEQQLIVLAAIGQELPHLHGVGGRRSAALVAVILPLVVFVSRKNVRALSPDMYESPMATMTGLLFSGAVRQVRAAAPATR